MTCLSETVVVECGQEEHNPDSIAIDRLVLCCDLCGRNFRESNLLPETKQRGIINFVKQIDTHTVHRQRCTDDVLALPQPVSRHDDLCIARTIVKNYRKWCLFLASVPFFWHHCDLSKIGTVTSPPQGDTAVPGPGWPRFSSGTTWNLQIWKWRSRKAHRRKSDGQKDTHLKPSQGSSCSWLPDRDSRPGNQADCVYPRPPDPEPLSWLTCHLHFLCGSVTVFVSCLLTLTGSVAFFSFLVWAEANLPWPPWLDLRDWREKTCYSSVERLFLHKILELVGASGQCFSTRTRIRVYSMWCV